MQLPFAFNYFINLCVPLENCFVKVDLIILFISIVQLNIK